MTRYFHGSATVLEPGEWLLPGHETLNIIHSRCDHVYLVHTDFTFTHREMPGHHPESVDSAEKYALWDALLWGCTAANISCGEECPHGYEDHGDAINEMIYPECVRVYEALPLGEVEPDGARDVGEESVRVSHAQILRVVPVEEIAQALGW